MTSSPQVSQQRNAMAARRSPKRGITALAAGSLALCLGLGVLGCAPTNKESSPATAGTATTTSPSGATTGTQNVGEKTSAATSDSSQTTGTPQVITAAEAHDMMTASTDLVVLDVRERDEYDTGHIEGSNLLPYGSIDETTAAQVIPTKDTTVLVYCRSGRRSAIAAQTLVDLGYANVYDFGGINDWPYETVTSA